MSGLYCVRRPWPGMARTIYGDHEKYLNTYFRQFPGWVAVLAYTEIHVAQVVHSYCNVFQFFCWWCSSSYIQYASKKITPTFGAFFQNVLAVQLAPQSGRLLPKTWKASSKQHWVRTHISFWNVVQELRLCLPSCVGNGKAEQQQKGFHKHESFLKMCTIIWRILE